MMKKGVLFYEKTNEEAAGGRVGAVLDFVGGAGGGIVPLLI
jgi:hypothetical protein